MLNSKLFLSVSTGILLISLLLSLGIFLSNNHSIYKDVEVIPIDGGAIGPESFDFNPVDGTGPYTGVSDGRIIRWIATEGRWTDFAITSPNRKGCGGPEMEHICGRPLGLKFDNSRGKLLIADAYFGLLSVGPNGGLATSLVSKDQGLPLMFSNSLDIDQTDGVVYFTDSSQRYTRRDHMLVVLTDEKSGRLLKYDLENRKVRVILYNLTFPNGVTLSQDGYPDNIKRNQKGEFWVAMFSKESKILRWVHSKPWIVYVLNKIIPINFVRVSSHIAKGKGEGLAIKLGVNGEILEILEDVHGKKWKYASEVMERDGNLWIGSVENNAAIKLKTQ
ncbi:unnamed protein product [Lactuca virosa]|uniref:Strictosidine synthase conserved region domain-containing protein n=1 Tax=Lactuca virosa TaxID=75947 RepID=A0AAU9LZS9_9ASTR|nr:unnamed protein product [Lactuca virosa]